MITALMGHCQFNYYQYTIIDMIHTVYCICNSLFNFIVVAHVISWSHALNCDTNHRQTTKNRNDVILK